MRENLLKRSKDDYLYADKDKFITSAYKKKLAEQAKWMEEEHQLREEKEDVTKKKDTTDFYFNLSKNVAFGAQDAETRKSKKQQKEATVSTSEERPQLTKLNSESTKPEEEHQGEASSLPEERSETMDAKPVPSAEQPRCGYHKIRDVKMQSLQLKNGFWHERKRAK